MEGDPSHPFQEGPCFVSVIVEKCRLQKNPEIVFNPFRDEMRGRAHAHAHARVPALPLGCSKKLLRGKTHAAVAKPTRLLPTSNTEW